MRHTWLIVGVLFLVVMGTFTALKLPQQSAPLLGQGSGSDNECVKWLSGSETCPAGWSAFPGYCFAPNGMDCTVHGTDGSTIYESSCNNGMCPMPTCAPQAEAKACHDNCVNQNWTCMSTCPPGNNSCSQACSDALRQCTSGCLPSCCNTSCGDQCGSVKNMCYVGCLSQCGACAENGEAENCAASCANTAASCTNGCGGNQSCIAACVLNAQICTTNCPDSCCVLRCAVQCDGNQACAVACSQQCGSAGSQPAVSASSESKGISSPSSAQSSNGKSASSAASSTAPSSVDPVCPCGNGGDGQCLCNTSWVSNGACAYNPTKKICTMKQTQTNYSCTSNKCSIGVAEMDIPCVCSSSSRSSVASSRSSASSIKCLSGDVCVAFEQCLDHGGIPKDPGFCGVSNDSGSPQELTCCEFKSSKSSSMKSSASSRSASVRPDSSRSFVSMGNCSSMSGGFQCPNPQPTCTIPPGKGAACTQACVDKLLACRMLAYQNPVMDNCGNNQAYLKCEDDYNQCDCLCRYSIDLRLCTSSSGGSQASSRAACPQGQLVCGVGDHVICSCNGQTNEVLCPASGCASCPVCSASSRGTSTYSNGSQGSVLSSVSQASNRSASSASPRSCTTTADCPAAPMSCTACSIQQSGACAMTCSTYTPSCVQGKCEVGVGVQSIACNPIQCTTTSQGSQASNTSSQGTQNSNGSTGSQASSTGTTGYCCVAGFCGAAQGCSLTQNQCQLDCNQPLPQSSSASQSNNQCFGNECENGGALFCGLQVPSQSCMNSPYLPCILCVSGGSISGDGADTAGNPPGNTSSVGVSSAPSVCISTCSNNLIECAEECDDGNLSNDDGCSNVCFLEGGSCGDAIIQSRLGEQCEPILEDPGVCDARTCRYLNQTTSSTRNNYHCGDGRRTGSEECDDGNSNNNDSCDTNCMLNSGRCGNGIVERKNNEECEPSKQTSIRCSSTCRYVFDEPPVSLFPVIPSSSYPVTEGLSSVSQKASSKAFYTYNPDTPNPQSILGCITDADCTSPARCILNRCLVPQEMSQLPPFCGNARVDLGEVCDDGSQNGNAPNAACRLDCLPSRCGDGIVDAPQEACDDGNLTRNDGCSSLCQLERAAPTPAQTLPAATIELPFTETQAPSSQSQDQLNQPVVVSTTPIASVITTKSPAPSTPSTGPAALAVMLAGAAAGYAFKRRK